MKASDKAARYLSRGMKTEFQVRNYLREKGYEQDEIDEAIEELKEYRFIDDYRYCKEFYIAGFNKNRGESRIRRELKDKGIERDEVDRALRELEEDGLVPDFFDVAMSVASQVTRQYSEEELENMEFTDKQKIKGKIARRLATRGFPQDIVYKVVRELVQ